MTTTVAQRIELNKASTVLSNGLTAMEFTALSDAAQTNSFPFEAVMLVHLCSECGAVATQGVDELGGEGALHCAAHPRAVIESVVGKL